MWNPTHVQFTVLRARNLVAKGKGGNNDVFATIQLGKEKYQTTTIKKARNPEWFEECDLSINNKDSEIKVNLFHRGKIADELIGYCIIPLQDYQNLDNEKSHWIVLKSKAKKNGIVNDQGELEVRLNFHMVKKDEEFPVLERKSYGGSLRHLATTMAGRLKRSQSLIHRKEKAKPALTLSNSSSKCSDSIISSQVLDFSSSKDELHMSNKNTGCSKSVDNIFMPQQHIHEQATCTPLTMAYLESKMYRCDDRPHSVANLNEKLKKSQYATIDEVLSDNTKAIHKSLENIASTSKDSAVSKSYTLPKIASNSYSALCQSKIEEETSVNNNNGTDIGEITPSVNHNQPSNFTNTITNGASGMNHAVDSNVVYRKAWDPSPRVKLRPSSCIVIGSSETSSQHLDTFPANDFTKDTGSSTVAQQKIKRRQRRIKKYNAYDCDQDADSEPDAEENRITLKKLQEEEILKINSNSNFNHKIPLMHPRIPQAGFDSKVNSTGTNSFKFLDGKEENGFIRDHLRRTELDFGSKHPELQIPGLKKRPISISFDGRLSDYSEIFPGYGTDNHLKSDDLVSVYRSMNKEELISRLICQKAQMIRKDQYIRGLESYIDDLLVGVIEQNPKILNRQFNY
ncbi:rab11 family-interacting protein 2-like isoform X2 [Argonauta hians]